jgi:hypothetical protein
MKRARIHQRPCRARTRDGECSSPEVHDPAGARDRAARLDQELQRLAAEIEAVLAEAGRA